MLSKWMGIGRLTADPEMKMIPTAKGDIPVANFTIAVDEDFAGAEGRATDFYDCVAYRKLAEIIGNNLKKGRLVSVVARPKERRWEQTIDGVTFHARKTEYSLSDCFFLDSKNKAADGGQAQAPDDDLPF